MESNQKTFRLLLVDDSDIPRKAMARFLKKHGYDVVEAGSGQEGDEMIRSAKPDAVLLDWEMPDIKGLDLLKSWSKDPEIRWVPVIMVTGHRDAESINQALAEGAIDFISKPPGNIELVARIRTALRIKCLQDELRDISNKDPLTGIYNRRYFDERLSYELSAAKRYARPLACSIIDIDFFKSINDNFGHDVGDLILKQISQHFISLSRDTDLVARYGGEEFIVLLGNTSINDGLICIERFRETVCNTMWGTKEEPLKITISAGLATYPQYGETDVRQLIKEADKALYLAKQSGRNKVVSAPSATVEQNIQTSL